MANVELAELLEKIGEDANVVNVLDNNPDNVDDKTGVVTEKIRQLHVKWGFHQQSLKTFSNCGMKFEMLSNIVKSVCLEMIEDVMPCLSYKLRLGK